MNMLRKIWAFICRDFRIAASYRLDFLLNGIYSLFILTLLYFIGNMIRPEVVGISSYNGGFFLFTLVGYAFYQYFILTLTGFSNSIQREQMSGCLEAIVATRTNPEISILMSSIYGLLSNLLHLTLIFVLGGVVFSAHLPEINTFSMLVTFILSIIVFMSLGIFSAAFVVVLKKGDPISWLFTTVTFVFGGAFFPVEQMPGWMQSVSRYLPTTYALNALRGAMINGDTISQLAEPILVLVAISAALMPTALFVFRRAVRKAKREGSLMYY